MPHEAVAPAGGRGVADGRTTSLMQCSELPESSMRPQAFIAPLGAAAAVLLKIARVGAATAFTSVIVSPAFPQDPVDATSACDRAAASPTDKNRPFGVPGVFFASIDPKVAIPACQQASAVAPENPRFSIN
jgi:hypothetical protein